METHVHVPPPRHIPQAAIYGIQFFDVLSRGSQFRVESMMLRVAKPLQYLLISPSKEQVYSVGFVVV